MSAPDDDEDEGEDGGDGDGHAVRPVPPSPTNCCNSQRTGPENSPALQDTLYSNIPGLQKKSCYYISEHKFVHRFHNILKFYR